MDRLYKAKGMDDLENKREPGNPVAKYARKKNLTNLLKIGNERLKKIFGEGRWHSTISKKSKKENSK